LLAGHQPYSLRLQYASLIEKLEDGKESKKYADELKAAFAEARPKQKEAFLNEARSWYEQDVTDLKAYKIENLGVRHNNRISSTARSSACMGF
jgi:uncharacterized membrane protein